MIQQNYAPSVPTANIAVNKSRIKLYSNGVEMPTYYLQKGQEFQIELFNPTSDVVLAKVNLNGKPISQGGLVLNPGQRVFLERYLDVAKKFLFDTYEVSNTEEVKKAIEENGDFKVEFFKEIVPIVPMVSPINVYPDWTYRPTIYFGNTNIAYSDTKSLDSTLTYGTAGLYNANIASSSVSMDLSSTSKKSKKLLRRATLSESIETGRVEKGSTSNQELKYVDKTFENYAFHTIEYKLLPVSQKINTVEDINVKRYCTNCGSKLGKTDRFCASCGTKA
jgi:ribosomal protein S4